MSIQYIRIHYGPVETFRLSAEHKPSYLKGLRVKLQKLGYRVDLVPSPFINDCVIECCDHVVFRCNIKSLCFNTPAERDPVCLNAIDAVQEANVKLTRSRNYLWLWMLIDQTIFIRSEWAPVDNWVPTDLPTQLESPDTCADCCGIHRTTVHDVADEVTDDSKFLEKYNLHFNDNEHRSEDLRHLEEQANADGNGHKAKV